MPERLKHHFEPKKGWMNDPKGCAITKASTRFFQHNPFAPHLGQDALGTRPARAT